MNPKIEVRALLLIGLLTIFPAIAAHSGDRAQPSLLSDSQQLDRSSHRYVYHYRLSNPSSNTAALDTLVIKLEPGVDDITDLRSPQGWHAFYSAERGEVLWTATDYRDNKAGDPSGNVPPSDFAVAPGATLSGFSFKSLSLPGVGSAITQSYAPLLVTYSEDALDAAESSRALSTLPEDNGFKLTTIVPVPSVNLNGRRRPTVDGFLVFSKIKATDGGSVLIVLRLAGAGETVFPSTLHVYLNGTEITDRFKPNIKSSGYEAILDPKTSPLVTGMNVVRSSIDGLVAGTTRRETDLDRVTFNYVL